MSFDAVDFGSKPAQDSRRITRAGTDIEHAIAGCDLGSFDHQGHDIRLRDRLSFRDGKRTVFVSKFLHPPVYENFARHLAHRFQHAHIGHTAPNDLRGDHALALNRAITDLNRQFGHVS